MDIISKKRMKSRLVCSSEKVANPLRSICRQFSSSFFPSSAVSIHRRRRTAIGSPGRARRVLCLEINGAEERQGGRAREGCIHGQHLRIDPTCWTTGRSALTCDVKLDAIMTGGRVFEVDAATVEALVGQRRSVYDQVAFARHLAVKSKAEVGPESKRRHFRPSPAHRERLAPSVEP